MTRAKRRWTTLRNRSMARKLASGECLSVLDEGEAIGGGLYRLRRFVEGKDYSDPITEAWIWSIGRNKVTGEIVASLSAELYQDEAWECLFLR